MPSGTRNHEHPHEALAVRHPAEVYPSSPRPYRGLVKLTYLLHDRNALVTARGWFCPHQKKIDIPPPHWPRLQLGIKKIDDRI